MQDKKQTKYEYNCVCNVLYITIYLWLYLENQINMGKIDKKSNVLGF